MLGVRCEPDHVGAEKKCPESGLDCLICAMFAGLTRSVSPTASERSGNYLKGVEGFYLEVKARIWHDAAVTLTFQKS